jgi:hypothetical protein
MLSPSSNPALVNNGLTNGETAAGMTFLIFFLIWGFFGLIAFIYSFICFSRSGTVLEKIFGVILAFFLGPFYFLYLRFNGGYCK